MSVKVKPEQLQLIRDFSRIFPNSAFLVLSETMLRKSIIDASSSIRKAFSDAQLHEYETQALGPFGKVTVSALIVSEKGGKVSRQRALASLYRPSAKQGDPRLWIHGLGEGASPGDLIAIGVVGSESLVVINLSRIPSGDVWDRLTHVVQGEARGFSGYQDPSLGRLLLSLAEISAAGPLAAVCEGDTAVGRTLESALGISMNSSKSPDWEDRIELKFGRRRPGQRRNLVALVADWTISPLKSSAEILDAFGYERNGIFRLYTEISSNPNSLGLYLEANELEGLIEERSANPSIPTVARWSLSRLATAIDSKHSRTCWITCESLELNGTEHFIPAEVRYTAGPRTDLLGTLINLGEITLDHLIKRTPSGGVNEKGPLWKVKPGSADLFFPLQAKYELAGREIRTLRD